MKILMITDLFPVDDFDVKTPRTLYDFVLGWKCDNHEVKILRPNFLFNSFVRNKKYYKTGWYADVYNVNYFLPFLGNIYHKLKDFFDENFEPDVVVSHMPSGSIFASKLGLNFSACVHCSDIEVLTNPIYSVYFKSELLKALRNANKIFCRSYSLKQKLLNLYPEFTDKIYLAPSGIAEKYIVNNVNNDINPSNLKICTCANLIKRKNVDKLVLAVKNFNNILLTVIGNGPELNQLKKLSPNIHFTGKLSHDNVLKIMRQNDIFILPSVNETFGMVYLEAMASGCISVCTKNDGVDGIIKNGENGFTVYPTVKSISETIKYILSLDKSVLNSIRLNSLNTVKHYTIKEVCQKYLLYLSE